MSMNQILNQVSNQRHYYNISVFAIFTGSDTKNVYKTPTTAELNVQIKVHKVHIIYLSFHSSENYIHITFINP